MTPLQEAHKAHTVTTIRLARESGMTKAETVQALVRLHTETLGVIIGHATDDRVALGRLIEDATLAAECHALDAFNRGLVGVQA